MIPLLKQQQQQQKEEKGQEEERRKNKPPFLKSKMKSMVKIRLDQITPPQEQQHDIQQQHEEKSETTNLKEIKNEITNIHKIRRPLLKKAATISQIYVNSARTKKEEDHRIRKERNKEEQSSLNTLTTDFTTITTTDSNESTRSLLKENEINTQNLHIRRQHRSKSFGRKKTFSLKNLMDSREPTNKEISKVVDDVIQKIEGEGKDIKLSSPGAHLRQEQDTRKKAIDSHTAFKQYFSCKSDSLKTVQTITKQELYASIVDKALSLLLANYFRGNVQLMEKNVPIEYTLSMHQLNTILRPIFDNLLLYIPDYISTTVRKQHENHYITKEIYNEEDSSDISEEGSPLLAYKPEKKVHLSKTTCASKKNEPELIAWQPSFTKENVDWYLEDELIFKEQLYQKPDQIYSLSTAASSGEHTYMEDAFTVYNHAEQLYGVDTKGKSILFLGVFDGHRGESASTYARAHLCSNVMRAVIDWESMSSIKEAFFEGFQKTNDDFLKHATDLQLHAGTCATAAFLVSGKQTKHLLVANVGDTQAVLGSIKDTRPIVLTTKHDPAMEKRRIRNAGGEVVYWMNTARVNGILGISRSIGDAQFNHLVPAHPDFQSIPLEHHHDCFVIATDGLWDVMTTREVLEFARKYPKREAVARALVLEAQQRRSKDNCTVLVLYFNQHGSVSSVSTTSSSSS